MERYDSGILTVRDLDPLAEKRHWPATTQDIVTGQQAKEDG